MATKTANGISGPSQSALKATSVTSNFYAGTELYDCNPSHGKDKKERFCQREIRTQLDQRLGIRISAHFCHKRD